MGWNSTVVVLNDALAEIEGDPDFGKNLVRAISSIDMPNRRSWVPAGSHANAASVVEQHHADGMIAVAVGGNVGTVLGYAGNWRATPEEMLRCLADSMGYRIVRKPKRGGK